MAEKKKHPNDLAEPYTPDEAHSIISSIEDALKLVQSDATCKILTGKLPRLDFTVRHLTAILEDEISEDDYMAADLTMFETIQMLEDRISKLERSLSEPSRGMRPCEINRKPRLGFDNWQPGLFHQFLSAGSEPINDYTYPCMSALVELPDGTMTMFPLDYFRFTTRTTDQP